MRKKKRIKGERKKISGVRIKRPNKDKQEKEMIESEKDKGAARVRVKWWREGRHVDLFRD